MRDPSIIFISNDVSNFRHHRKHLIDVAVEMGMRPILLAGGARSEPPADCEYRPLKIERFHLHWADFRMLYAIGRQILSEQPQVVHLINIKPYLYGGLAAQLVKLFGWRGRVVVSIPGLGRLYDKTENTFAKWVRKISVEFALRIGLRGATACFETRSDRDFWLDRGLTKPKLTLVTNGTGIDLSSFQRKATEPAINCASSMPDAS